MTLSYVKALRVFTVLGPGAAHEPENCPQYISAQIPNKAFIPDEMAWFPAAPGPSGKTLETPPSAHASIQQCSADL